jgi:hypothetical protein
MRMSTSVAARHGLALIVCIWLIWQGWSSVRFGIDALLTAPTPASPLNAVDLRHRVDETRLWFSGQSAYLKKPESAVYPPAAYPVFWLLLGWGEISSILRIWALLSLLGLLLLSVWAARVVSLVSELRGVQFVLPIALVATKIALGLGQASLILVPISIGAAQLAFQPARDRRQQVLLIGLLLVALVKPSIALPFIVLCALRMTWGERSALVVGYAALTLTAAWFQPVGVIELIGQWQRNTAAVVGSNDFGYANLNWALTKAGFANWNTIASLAALGVYGAWAWIRRDLRMLPAIAICALVARLWAYHSSYDDLLVVPAIVALCVARPRWLALPLAGAIALSGLEGVQPYGYQLFGGDGFAWLMALLWIAALLCLVRDNRSELQLYGEKRPVTYR